MTIVIMMMTMMTMMKEEGGREGDGDGEEFAGHLTCYKQQV